VVALKNTEEQRLGVRNNAKVSGWLIRDLPVVIVIAIPQISFAKTLQRRKEYLLRYSFDDFIVEKNAVKDLRDAVINQDPKVTGALLDSYVAGYWAKVASEKVLNNPDLRVGTVLDHQFAYGFVITGALENDATEKCMRKKLNSMETEITNIIQQMAETMEVRISC